MGKEKSWCSVCTIFQGNISSYFAGADVIISIFVPESFAVSTYCVKILAQTAVFQKRITSTFGISGGFVAKYERLVLVL